MDKSCKSKNGSKAEKTASMHAIPNTVAKHKNPMIRPVGPKANTGGNVK